MERSDVSGRTRQKPFGAGQRRTGRTDSCLAFWAALRPAQYHERNPEIICPGTNTKLAATSPEIICPFGIRAGSLLDVADTHQEHQRRMHSQKPFQHLLSPELARTYSCRLVRKMWIKQ
jgi:hypothetical protein